MSSSCTAGRGGRSVPVAGTCFSEVLVSGRAEPVTGAGAGALFICAHSSSTLTVAADGSGSNIFCNSLLCARDTFVSSFLLVFLSIDVTI